MSTSSDAGAVAPRPTVWGAAHVVAADRSLRWVFALLFLYAISASLVVPGLALFAKNDLGATTFEVALYFAATSMAGAAVVVAVGRFSDVLSSRRALIVGGFLWLGVGYVALSVVQAYIHMLAVGVLFSSALGVGSAQLFAYSKDAMDERPGGAVGSITGFLRMAYSLGWVLGPALGGLSLLVVDARGLFRLAAVVYGVGAALAWSALPPLATRTPGDGARLGAALAVTRAGRGPLLAFAAAIACILSGDVLRVALLPLHLQRALHARPEDLGLAFSMTPLLEVPLMPLVGAWADRIGARRMLICGAAAGCAYYVGLALSGAVWQVLILQAGYAFVVASVIGVGIGYAQRLAEGEAGLATSVYFSAENVAVIGGSVVSGLASQRFGLRAGFAVAGILCVCGLGLLSRIRVDRARHGTECN